MDLLKEFLAIDYKTVLIGIFTIIGTFIFAVEAFKKLFNILGIESKWLKRNESIEKAKERINSIEHYQELNYQAIKEISNNISSMSEQLSDIKGQNKDITDALIESMADRISQKCEFYINKSRGIPEDEVEDFVRYFDNYEKIGGNHGLNKKVSYCLNNLPILPSNYPKE